MSSPNYTNNLESVTRIFHTIGKNCAYCYHSNSVEVLCVPSMTHEYGTNTRHVVQYSELKFFNASTETVCLENHSEILGLYFLNSCKCYKKFDMIFRMSQVLEVVMVQLVFQTVNYVLETVYFTVISWKLVEIPPQS